jgi:SAM-dependent methyltransferase
VSPVADRSTRADSFGAVARTYDRFRPPTTPAALEWLLPERCEVAVDLGAGTGSLSRLLLARTPTVRRIVAVEPDSRMRTVLAERLPGVETLDGRGESIPLPDGSVDAVLACSSWHWMDSDLAFPEVARVLRPGGVLGLVWSGPDRAVPWVGEVLRPGFSRHDGAATPAGARSSRREVRLPADSAFVEPESAVLRWSIPRSGEELVGLAGTYSSMITLPDDERDSIIEQVRARVAQQLGGDLRAVTQLPMACRCWRATRH